MHIKLFIGFFLLGLLPALCSAASEPATQPAAPNVPKADRTSIRLIVADGQLTSHPLRVFVTHHITESMSPTLRLMPSHTLLKAQAGEGNPIEPSIVAPDQQETVEVNGTQTSLNGTVLVFDVRNYPVSLIKAMTRVEPVLEWNEPNGDNAVPARALGPAIYLGNITIAVIYTVIAVAFVLAAIVRLLTTSWPLWKNAGDLLRGPNGKISLSRLQVIVWTIAIGALVLLYGMIRLNVPDIPETLVMLMGMSVLTTGISQAKVTQQVQNAQAAAAANNALPPNPPPQAPLRWGDLLRDDDGPSLAKTQLLFWTVLTISLFVAKSLLGGALWDVPGQLVALMGISQVGYLGQKFDPTDPKNKT